MILLLTSVDVTMETVVDVVGAGIGATTAGVGFGRGLIACEDFGISATAVTRVAAGVGVGKGAEAGI